jgi:hypothetical protein
MGLSAKRLRQGVIGRQRYPYSGWLAKAADSSCSCCNHHIQHRCWSSLLNTLTGIRPLLAARSVFVPSGLKNTWLPGWRIAAPLAEKSRTEERSSKMTSLEHSRPALSPRSAVCHRVLIRKPLRATMTAAAVKGSESFSAKLWVAAAAAPDRS